ncbi:hypothetical protein ACGF5C_12375 [Micromonospora sp. NPDC047620]|uniref:hypothetical protein n=1 Tax=Micromonospora sp. NPDC047620 TaxID=3364251 RepID=UPI00371E7126
MLKRVVASAAVVASSLVAGALAVPVAAQASTRYGCTYPRVCFYLTPSDWTAQRPTAAYQDVTSTWQTLGSSSRGSAYAFNSRNDDVAYFHFTNGRQVCLRPDSPLYLSQYGTVDKIRISSSSTC